MTILCTSIRNRNKWINNHKFIYLAVVCSFWAFLQFIYGYSNQFAIHMVKFDLNALIKRFWTIFEDFQAQSSTGSPMSKEIWHVSNCSVQRKFQFCKFIPPSSSITIITIVLKVLGVEVIFVCVHVLWIKSLHRVPCSVLGTVFYLFKSNSMNFVGNVMIKEEKRTSLCLFSLSIFGK